MSLEILRAGPLTLVQDYGRLGWQHLGMAPGGPADEHAFLWANKLLENTATAAMLEITLGPFSLKAHHTVQIALTGAEMHAQRNGEALDNWTSHCLQAGDQLDLKMATQGLRGYLAVSGGLQMPTTFGSCASVVRDQLGGLDGTGRALQNGDRLEHASVSAPQISRSVPPDFRPDYTEILTLRLLPSYQWQQFHHTQHERLWQSEYQVASASDRMGYTLQGLSIQPPRTPLISEGIAYGAVQIPPNGQPIILLKDRQSIGGYPKLGCVAALDCAQLAQRRPGQAIRFQRAKLTKLSQQQFAFQHFFGLDAAKSKP